MERVYKVTRKKCGFRGCNATGVYTPVIMVPLAPKRSGLVTSTNGRDKPLEIELEVEACERHRRNPKAAFLSPEGYRHILKLMKKHGINDEPPIAALELWFKTEEGILLPWSATQPSE